MKKENKLSASSSCPNIMSCDALAAELAGIIDPDKFFVSRSFGRKLTEYNSQDADETRAFVLHDMTEADFDAVRSSLVAGNLEEEYFRRIEGNLFCRFIQGTDAVGVSFFGNEGVLCLTLDRNAVRERDFSDADKDANGTAEFYLYGLNMDPGGYNPVGKADSHLNTSGLPNCGQIMIVKCRDGSVIVIDGGLSVQWRNGALAELDAFLHRITDTPADGVVRISCWMLTHFHNDHMDGFIDLLDKFGSGYALERILCNLPSSEDYPKGCNLERMKLLAGMIAEKYPDCREMKVRTGQTVEIGGVRIETLYTHEDSDHLPEHRVHKDLNNTSSVFRLSSDGMSLAVLGDISETAEATLTLNFGQSTLKSDLVQVAHHCFNRLQRIYPLIDAPVALFTQTEKGSQKNDFVKTNSDEAVKVSRFCFYAGDASKTVGFSRTGDDIYIINRGGFYLSCPERIFNVFHE